MNLVAVIEIAIISIYFILPFVPAGVPFSENFDWKFVNYAPILTVGSLVVLWIWWQVSAKNWFTGPEAHHRPGGGRGLRRVRSGLTLEEALEQLPALDGARRGDRAPGRAHEPQLPGPDGDAGRRRPDLAAEHRPPRHRPGAEWHNTVAAAAAGVGAPVVGYLAGRGVLVVGFLPDAPTTPRTWATTCRGWPRHCACCTPGPAFASRFDMFEVQRQYRAIVRVAGSPCRRGMPRWPRRLRRSRPRCASAPSRWCPATTTCWPPTSSTTGVRLRIIDYEYSGMNEASFELGNLVNESHLDHDHLAELVGAYYGRVESRDCWRGPSCGDWRVATPGRCGARSSTASRTWTTTSGTSRSNASSRPRACSPARGCETSWTPPQALRCSRDRTLPSRARVVIIGGGVIGCSVAYHLAHLGWTDVVVLEQGTLSCGTTWHAAGLVGQLRATEASTRLVQYSTDLYARLEAETGLATGYRVCGGLIAGAHPRADGPAAAHGRQRGGLRPRVQLLTPHEAGERYPLIQADDVAGCDLAARGRTR